MPSYSRIPQYKSNAFRKQLIVWVRASDPNRPANIQQSATDELLAEHQLTEAALSAMEAEAYRLAHQQAYRPEFWSGMVDFVGNFIHLCHRKKEESCLFPTLVANGMKAEVDLYLQEHKHAEATTFDLLEALGEADWEKVLRLVSIYVPAVRAHMGKEERQVFVPSVPVVSPELAAEMRISFDAFEAKILPKNGRKHYFDLVCGLCKDAGLPDPLEA
jgi:hemerythrin-like domain-containing protein